jgi:hypothetical protein
MSLRPIYLLVDGRTSKSGGHFAIFIPNAPENANQPPSSSSTTNPSCCTGTVIHVVGNPLIGFHHEFKRNYNTSDGDAFRSLATPILLGHVDPSLHADPTIPGFTTDTTPLGSLDAAALQVPCPGRSDVRAAVDGVCLSFYSTFLVRGVGGAYLTPYLTLPYPRYLICICARPVANMACHVLR